MSEGDVDDESELSAVIRGSPTAIMRDGLWARLKLFPFQVAFAGLALIAGLVGLLDIGTSTDALTLLMPKLLVTGLNILYLLSGIAILLGLMLPRRDVEGFGLVQLTAAVVIRAVAVIAVAGFGPDIAALEILYLLIAWACVVRLQTLIRTKQAVTHG